MRLEVANEWAVRELMFILLKMKQHKIVRLLCKFNTQIITHYSLINLLRRLCFDSNGVEFFDFISNTSINCSMSLKWHHSFELFRHDVYLQLINTFSFYMNFVKVSVGIIHFECSRVKLFLKFALHIIQNSKAAEGEPTHERGLLQWNEKSYFVHY